MLGLEFTSNLATVNHHHTVSNIMYVQDVMVDKNGGFTCLLDAVNKVDLFG